jgi:hypothetical protein
MSGANNQIYIFLDLDGVLTDFQAHLKEEHKRPDGHPIMENLDHDWWSTIPPCEGAREFYDEVKKLGIVKFLTIAAQHEDSYSGKAHWVQDFVPERGQSILRDLIVCGFGDKALLATPTRILVDDRQSNIDGWVKAGGIGILHKGDFSETLQKVQEAVDQLNAQAPKPVVPPRPPKSPKP